jgi:RNA polymerase sigma-70 factor (ECF subfamily)
MPALPNLADDDLLRLTQAGNELAFTTLYQRRQGAVYRFALQMSGNICIAEEVTQEVFLNLLRERGAYDGKRGPLVSYLYGTARHLVWRRMAQNRSQISITVEDGEDQVTPGYLISHSEIESDLARDEITRSLRRAILTMPAGYREAVVLCDLHELSYQEAALVLGCAVGTVRSRLHRARALLSEKLAPTRIRSNRCLV